MKSILRFLLFVALVALLVSVMYFWRAAMPSRSTAPGSANTPSVIMTPDSHDHVAAVAPDVQLSVPGLEMLDREFTQLVAKVLPSVVSITAIPAKVVEPRYRLMQRFFGGPLMDVPPQMGSGAIVSSEGHIVTNYHVVQNAASIEVHLNDGRVMPARLLGSDPRADVAVLKIDTQGLTPMVFANSDAVKVGQIVFAIGNPFGLQETVTQGIISATGRRTMSEATNEYFQTNADINPGNSGGPLVNLKGEIIGISNFIVTSSGGSQGIGFAIPSNTARKVFENIRDFGRVIRPWFGVSMKSITPQLAGYLGFPDQKGALVFTVTDGSPAERAGLLPGDVILSFNNKSIADPIDLRHRVAETEANMSVPITVWREGKEVKLQAQIQEDPGAAWTLPIDTLGRQN